MHPSRYKVHVDCEDDFIRGTKKYTVDLTAKLPDNIIDADDKFSTARRVLILLFGKTHNGNTLQWHYDKHKVPFRKIGEATTRLTFYSSLGVYTVHLCPIFLPTSGYISGYASRDMTGPDFDAMAGKCFAVESATTDGYIAALTAYVDRFMRDCCFNVAGLVEYKSGGSTYAAVTLSYGGTTATLMAIFTSDIFVAYK